MAAEQRVDDVISPKAGQQLDEYISGLERATVAVEKLAQVSRTISIDFRGVKDLAALQELQAKFAAQTEQMAKGQQQYEEAVKKRQNAEEKAEQKRQQQFEAELRRQDRLQQEGNRAIAEKEKAAERERIALEKLNNEYEQAKRKYKELADESKRLAFATGDNAKRYKEVTAEANKMYAKLLEVERAVGQGQRAVGQYNQAFFGMQQVLRETPSLMNGVNVWLSAVSNNIVQVRDDMKRMKEANEALIASGGQAIPVWRQMASAIFSWETAILAAITVLPTIIKELDLFGKKTDEAAEATKKLNMELDDIKAKETVNAQIRNKAMSDNIALVKDETASINVRKRAFEELQKDYPQYLKNLKFEDLLKGKADKQLSDMSEEIKYKLMLNTAQGKYNKLLEESVRLTGEINAATDEDVSRPLIARRDEINKQIKELEKELTGLNAAMLTFPSANTPETGGTLSPLAPNLQGDDAIAKATREREMQRLQVIIETQKAISDNQEKSEQERLVASSVYHAAQIEQQKAALAASLQIEEAYIKESETRSAALRRRRAELLEGRGGLTGEARLVAMQNIDAQLEDEEKLREAAQIRSKAALEKYNAETIAIVEEAAKERLAITKSEVSEWVKVQEDAFAKSRLDQLIGYMAEKKLLKAKFDANLISRKKYEQELKELQHKQRINELEAQVELDRRILSNTQLTAEQQLQYKRKLIADEKALEDERARLTSPSMRKGAGRPTDAIATLFGGGAFEKAELDQRKKYLQSFYDAAVNMARQAADTIMAIENAKYDAEIQKINERQEANRRSYQEQVDAINATTTSEIERRNQLSKLAAQQQAQDAAFEQEKRRIAIQQARFQRTAAIASAIANGAVAVTKTLAELGPLAAPIIPLIAGTTALQVAAITSTPIPQYAEGTLSHPGGKFIAGDGGQIEYIAPPNKQGYWSKSTPTLYDEPKGTKVIPLDKMIKDTKGYKPGQLNEVTSSSEFMYQLLGDIIGERFDNTGERLATVVARYGYKPQKQESITDAVRSLKNMQGL